MTNQQIRADAYLRFQDNRSLCFQRAIRESYSDNIGGSPVSSLKEARVIQVDKAKASEIILKYEWLGSLGRTRCYYGLFVGDVYLGVACFGLPTAIQSRDICGVDLRSSAICLMRGACTHLAPKNSASFLIRRACKMAHAQYGWSIFYAYADPEAGEIGNVYQASNWKYIGQGVGRTPGRLRDEWVLPDGNRVSSRYLRHRGLKNADALSLGWKRVFALPKHKYVWFEGTKKETKRLEALCRYPFLPYPKNRTRDMADMKTIDIK